MPMSYYICKKCTNYTSTYVCKKTVCCMLFCRQFFFVSWHNKMLLNLLPVRGKFKLHIFHRIS